MANRRRHRSDAPPLFEDFELEDPKDDDSENERSGLDQIVTRVNARPKGWAMKWRPDESKSVVDTEVDRHPARPAGIDPEPETTPADADPRGVTSEEPGAAEKVVEPEVVEPEVIEPEMVEPETAEETSEPVLTSRTWSATVERESRHPRTPGAAAASTSPTRTAPTTRMAPIARPRTPISRAGWPAAILLAAAWGVTALTSGPPAASPDGDVELDDAAAPMAPILARPTEAELMEAELLRSELASMREERARLVAEVDAAFVLLQDHRRLSRELQESMATHRGASIEVDALADDLRRWQRRHAVALGRLDEMDLELVRSDELVAALEAEVERLQDRLDASGGTD
jgi:hypothetical protein